MSASLPNRQSIRKRGWNYATPGWYFVTINTHEGRALFGVIVNGRMVLSEAGRIAEEEWRKSAVIRKGIELDEFVVMPNHVHGIVRDEKALANIRNYIRFNPAKYERVMKGGCHPIWITAAGLPGAAYETTSRMAALGDSVRQRKPRSRLPLGELKFGSLSRVSGCRTRIAEQHTQGPRLPHVAGLVAAVLG